MGDVVRYTANQGQPIVYIEVSGSRRTPVTEYTAELCLIARASSLGVCPITSFSSRSEIQSLKTNFFSHAFGKDSACGLRDVCIWDDMTYLWLYVRKDKLRTLLASGTRA